MILAWLLTESAGKLPDGWASELRTLAAQAGTAEKDTALAQFTTALATIAADSAVVSHLRHILGLTACSYRSRAGMNSSWVRFLWREHQAARARLAWWLRWCSRWRW
jgi:hypothetical protein